MPDEISDPRIAELIAFWSGAGPARWFAADDGFDAECRARWLASHEAAAAGCFDAWTETPAGALALILLLDQIPRNIFRGTPRAWATDVAALAVAETTVARGDDTAIDKPLRLFVYLPFMHAESPAAQERSLDLYAAYGEAEQIDYARHHHGIVSRFGRFPHRNAPLGRPSTPDEIAFLETDPVRG